MDAELANGLIDYHNWVNKLNDLALRLLCRDVGITCWYTRDRGDMIRLLTFNQKAIKVFEASHS